MGEKAATGLTGQLKQLGFRSGRMKTGTPPRIDGRTIDYSKLEEGVTQSLKEIFRPEFLNRVDETVVFHSLGRDDLTRIIHLMVGQFIEEIKEKNIKLEVTDDAVNRILESEYDEKFGARPLRRGVQKYIEDVLSEKYIQRELKDGNTVKVDYKDGEFSYKITE